MRKQYSDPSVSEAKLLNNIWQLNLFPKLKFFAWKLIHQTLLTRNKMRNIDILSMGISLSASKHKKLHITYLNMIWKNLSGYYPPHKDTKGFYWVGGDHILSNSVSSLLTHPYFLSHSFLYWAIILLIGALDLATKLVWHTYYVAVFHCFWFDPYFFQPLYHAIIFRSLVFSFVSFKGNQGSLTLVSFFLFSCR